MTDTTKTQTKLVAHQVELEKLFSKNQLIPRIRQEFQTCPLFDFPAYIQKLGIPLMFGLDLLVQMALHKRANLPTLVGVMYHHLKDAQATVDMLHKAAVGDLINWSSVESMFVVQFTLGADTQAELDRYQFPLPMVVEPRCIRNNRESGYFLNNGSVILRNNHHEDDVCLDHLNRLNRIKLSINLDVVQHVKNKWKNLDKQKDGETRDKFESRKRAFAKYDRTAKDVIAKITEHSDSFYLTHKYDKRGRTYSMGYHVNYQGNPWNKACIEFSEKELIE